MDFDEQEEEQVEDMATRVDVDRRQFGGRSSTYDSDPHPPPPPPPPLPQPPTQPRVGNLTARGGSNVDGGKYKECLKNHAVSIGGHAIDGCGEFMAAGEEGTADALKCAACNCHRNFHRKESGTDVVGGFSLMGITGGDAGGNMGGHGFHPHFTTAYNYRTPASGYFHHRGPPPPLALPSTSGAGEGSREEGEDVSNPMMMMRLGSTSGSGSKKRFRTRFTQDQKEKMLAFAERVGWRIQRHDEVLVQQFCSDIGVRRHVLKVWMHNNKNTLGKKP